MLYVLASPTTNISVYFCLLSHILFFFFLLLLSAQDDRVFVCGVDYREEDFMIPDEEQVWRCAAGHFLLLITC